MCGIAGILNPSKPSLDALKKNLERMTDSISHRGPDSDGHWYDHEQGVALGHRRLAIIDLSPTGFQPMASASGRYEITQNGEIYNYLELRNELIANGMTFKGGSDTEVLLNGFDFWGISETLKKSVGMFAFAVWDRQTNELVLARDRMGEKPLYYGVNNNVFLFASELKAITSHEGFQGELNHDAVTLYLRHNCIPSPHSIYKNLFKLEPGTIVRAKLNKNEITISPLEKYWDLKEVFNEGIACPIDGSDEDVLSQLEGHLDNSVAHQMISDVPIGGFLSGGIDSSLVVALMQKNSVKPIKSFTIGFNEDTYNEAKFAKAVAKHIGTDHTELYVSQNDARDVIPSLSQMYDEPFADSSQIPTFLVSKMARNKVTVALSGDAGDELFGGYNRYLWSGKIWGMSKNTPQIFKNIFTKTALGASPAFWNSAFKPLQMLHPRLKNFKNFGDKLHKLAHGFDVNSIEELYFYYVSHWKNPDQIVKNGMEPQSKITDKSMHLETDDPIMQMMFLDLLTYLPDDNLAKIDRAAMRVALETRAPLLDRDVVKFAAALPTRFKVRNNVGKWCLRQILDKYVPRNLIERPKMGFAVPIEYWLRHELKEWGEDLLSADKLEEQGIFEAREIRLKWEEHQSGKKNWHYHLWTVLMFQAWYQEHKDTFSI